LLNKTPVKDGQVKKSEEKLSISYIEVMVQGMEA